MSEPTTVDPRRDKTPESIIREEAELRAFLGRSKVSPPEVTEEEPVFQQASLPTRRKVLRVEHEKAGTFYVEYTSASVNVERGSMMLRVPDKSDSLRWRPVDMEPYTLHVEGKALKLLFMMDHSDAEQQELILLFAHDTTPAAPA